MKINIKYDALMQTENICGPFIFIRDGDRIRNLEARW